MILVCVLFFSITVVLFPTLYVLSIEMDMAGQGNLVSNHIQYMYSPQLTFQSSQILCGLFGSRLIAERKEDIID